MLPNVIILLARLLSERQDYWARADLYAGRKA